MKREDWFLTMAVNASIFFALWQQSIYAGIFMASTLLLVIFLVDWR